MSIFNSDICLVYSVIVDIPSTVRCAVGVQIVVRTYTGKFKLLYKVINFFKLTISVNIILL